MGSLASCMKKAGKALSAEDKAAIIDASRGFRAEGMSASEAAKKAVDARIAHVSGLLKAAGEQPDEVQASAPTEKPEATAPSVTARPTGFPAGGYYAHGPDGEIIKRDGWKPGDNNRRFDDREKAIAWGEQQLAKQQQKAATPIQQGVAPEKSKSRDYAKSAASPYAETIAAKSESNAPTKTGPTKATLSDIATWKGVKVTDLTPEDVVAGNRAYLADRVAAMRARGIAEDHAVLKSLDKQSKTSDAADLVTQLAAKQKAAERTKPAGPSLKEAKAYAKEKGLTNYAEHLDGMGRGGALTMSAADRAVIADMYAGKPYAMGADGVPTFRLSDSNDPAQYTRKQFEAATDEQSRKDERQLDKLLRYNAGGDVARPVEGAQPIYRVVNVPDAAVERTIGRVFGKRVVFVQRTTELLGHPDVREFNGVTIGAIPDAIFLNAEWQRPHMAVLGHELVHELVRDNQPMYQRLVDALRPYVKNDEYRSHFWKSPIASHLRNEDGTPQSEAIREEFVAEVVSDGFMNPVFWETMGKTDVSLLTHIVNMAKRFIAKIKAAIGQTNRTERYLNDFEAAMRVAGEVMRDYAADRAANSTTKRSDTQTFTFAKGDISNADVGKRFNAMVKGARSDLEGVLMNWNESELSEDGDKIIRYPGRDAYKSRGVEGGKDNVSKRAFLDWLGSEAPFDTKVYGQAITNNQEWRDQINGLRELAGLASAPTMSKVDGKPIASFFASSRAQKILNESEANGAGPFDGGCLICAKAIIMAAGKGSLVRVVSKENDGQTEHYGALIDGTIYDAAGAHASPELWAAEFAERENITDRGVSVAYGYDENSEIPDDHRASRQMANALDRKNLTFGDDADIRFDLSRKKLVDQVSEVIETDPTFNLLNRTVNTQAYKAWKSPEFRRVYQLVQQYIKDTARFAHEAASMAPNLLPAWDRMLGVNGVLSFSAIKRDMTGQTGKERRRVGYAVFQGTLTDKKVYTDAELVKQFKLTPREIVMYREALAATKASLVNLAVSSMYQLAKTVGVDIDVSSDALLDAHSRLSDAIEQVAPDNMPELLSNLDDIAGGVDHMVESGYFPLMRFGDHTLTVQDQSGEVAFFRMYESKAAMANDLQAMRSDKKYAGMTIKTGVMANATHELYRGLTSDALEVFAQTVGASDVALFQDYLRVAVANGSAMKRLIERKGIAGFDEDITRTLSAFITSNSRLAARNYHWSDTVRAAAAIPKEKGDVADQAVGLLTYVSDNREEASWIRNLMFVNFLGGSIASAALNTTQPFTVTLPYLSQWGGAAEVPKALAMMTKASTMPADLAKALQRATEDGVIAPHEIHNLYAESDNGWMDRLHIPEGAQIGVRRGLLLWGSAFAAAESFNRKLSFIAGYNAYAKINEKQRKELRDQDINNAYQFAEKTVDDTQFVYNKGNRPNWARGAVGATLFTFKTFTVSMLEVIAKADPKAKAMIGAALILIAGLKGLPFEEDVEDLIDTIGQALGYNTNSGKSLELKVKEVLGQTLGGLLLYGATGTGALGADVSQRMGMSNIIPGSKAFLQSKDANAKVKEIGEAFGALGGLVQQAMRAVDGVQSRGLAGLSEGAPIAIANMLKASDMLDKGMYRDAGGRKVVDTTPLDAVLKALGFQPAKVASAQRAYGMIADDAALLRNVTRDITDAMARAQFEKMHASSPEKEKRADEQLDAAYAEIDKWNQRNPEALISIRGQDVSKRVSDMERDKENRLLRSSPKGMRSDAMETLRQLRQ